MKAPMKKINIYCEIAFRVVATLFNEVWKIIETNDRKIIKIKNNLIKRIDLTKIYLIWNNVIAKKKKKEKETKTKDITLT